MFELIHGDCIQFMRTMPDKSVDFVLTDPPYSSGGLHHYARRQSSSQKYTQKIDYLPFEHDIKDQRSWMLWMREWLAHARRILKDGGIVATFVDWRQLPAMTDSVQLADFMWQGTAVWLKPPGTVRPRNGGISQSCEFIVWATRGKLLQTNRFARGEVLARLNTAHKLHPTEKPVAVMKHILALAGPRSIILDPFMGSGTTGVAAIQLGHKFIGIEMNGDYLAIARKRIEAARPDFQPLIGELK